MDFEINKLYFQINQLIETTKSENGGVICELWSTGNDDIKYLFIDMGLGIYNDNVKYQKKLFLNQAMKIMISLKKEIDIHLETNQNYCKISNIETDDIMDDIN